MCTCAWSTTHYPGQKVSPLEDAALIIDKLEAEVKKLKKLNSYTRGALNRICSDVSNGEHISKEWIEQTIIGYCDDMMKNAFNSKIRTIEAENKRLREAAKVHIEGYRETLTKCPSCGFDALKLHSEEIKKLKEESSRLLDYTYDLEDTLERVREALNERR